MFRTAARIPVTPPQKGGLHLKLQTKDFLARGEDSGGFLLFTVSVEVLCSGFAELYLKGEGLFHNFKLISYGSEPVLFFSSSPYVHEVFYSCSLVC